MSENQGLWKLSVVRGLLALAAGIVLIAWPDIVLALGVIIYGAYSIALGVVDGGALLLGRVQADNRGLLLFLAALNIGVGVLLVSYPQRTASLVLALAGIAIVIEGLARLFRTVRGWEGGAVGWASGAVAIGEVFIGIAFIASPLLAAVGFVALLGGLVLVYGIIGVGAGLAIRASDRAGSGGGPVSPV